MANSSELYGRTLGARASAQVAGQAEAQAKVLASATQQQTAFKKSESIKELETKKAEVQQKAKDIDVQLKQQDEWVNESVEDDSLDAKSKSEIVKQYNQNVRMLQAEKSQMTSQIPVYDSFISEIKSLPTNQYYEPSEVINIASQTGHETYLKSAYIQAKAERQEEIKQVETQKAFEQRYGTKMVEMGNKFYGSGGAIYEKTQAGEIGKRVGWISPSAPTSPYYQRYAQGKEVTGEKLELTRQAEIQKIKQDKLIEGIKANKTVGQLRSEGYNLVEIGLMAKSLIKEQEQTQKVPEVTPTKQPTNKIIEGYAKYLVTGIQIGEAAGLGLAARLETPAPYTKEEMQRLQEIGKKPESILGYPKKMYEYVKLTGELQAKVDEASKFTEKVQPIIEENYKNLEKENKEYTNAVEDYNKFIEKNGIKTPAGTYELDEKGYNSALLLKNNLDNLQNKFNLKANEVKETFSKNGIAFKDTDNGIEITDERIKRMGKYKTLSQVYLEQKKLGGYKELLKGQAIIGTVWGLETAGWTVVLTPVIPIAARLPVINKIVGLGRYIAQPIKVAAGLTLAAGFTGISAYKGYKELEPIGMGKAGAIMGAASFVGGVVVAGTLMKLGDAALKIIESPEFAEKVKLNVNQLLEDKSGELSPAKRKAKAKQQLVQIKKKVESSLLPEEKSAYKIRFQMLSPEEQKQQIIKNLKYLNTLQTQEEKTQALLSIEAFLKEAIGKDKAVLLIREIFGIQPVKVSYGLQKQMVAQIPKPIRIYLPPKPTQIFKPSQSLIFKPLTITKQMQRYRLETGLGLKQGQLQKMKQEQRTIQVSAQALSQKYNQQVKQAQTLALKQESRLQQQYKLSQKTIQAQTSMQKSQQATQQTQMYKQLQKTIQQQKVRQEQVLRQVTRLRTTLRIQPVKPIEKKIIIPVFKFDEAKSAKRRKELEEQSANAYQALIKRSGKWKPIGKPLYKGEAIRAGERVTRQTLAATFKVVPTKLRVKAGVPYKPSEEFRTFKIERGKRVPLVDTFIQERKYRLSARSEVSEIQKARRISQSMNLKARNYLR